MKRSIRYLSLLLCFALLSIGFSSVVSADSDDTQKAYFTRRALITNSWLSSSYNYAYPSDLKQGEFVQVTTEGNYGIPPNTTYYSIRDTFIVESYDRSSPIIKKGLSTSVNVYNLYASVGVNHPSGFYYLYGAQFEQALINYIDGTSEYIEKVDNFKMNGNFIDVGLTFEPNKDVKSIEFQFIRTGQALSVNQAVQITIYSGMSTTLTTFMTSQSSEESGLLKSVIEWLKGIKNGITDGFDTVSNGFLSVVSYIAELPQNLWNLISEGLKNLFVPDDEFIVSYKSRWDELLADRFGALYQCGSIVISLIYQIFLLVQ